MKKGDYIDGVVSLWIGTADSEDGLAMYADCDDPRHADRTLARDFGTGRYDHDFMDISVEKPTRSLSELLRGCSYDTIVIPKFVEMCGDVLPEQVNAFVLLYNFQHYGQPGDRSGASGPVRLRFMGSITVPMPWPD